MDKNETFNREEHEKGFDEDINRASAPDSTSAGQPTADKEDKEKGKKPEDPRALKRKGMTYRIGQELIDRINETAAQYNVEKTGLVKVLLTYALDDLDAGNFELKTKSGKLKLEL